jgi:hypothetical protein
MIRGEWWIHHDGSITYCDGDYGEANHEMIVKFHAISVLADWFGCSLNSHEPTLEDLLYALGVDPDMGVDDLLAKCETIGQVPLWQIAVDSSNIDSRAYAMRLWGWHAVRGNHVETWEITDATANEILKGIWKILEYDCEEIDPDCNVHINGTKGRRCVTLTGRQIESGEWPSDSKAGAPSYEITAPNAALVAMDRQLEHPYYRE